MRPLRREQFLSSKSAWCLNIFIWCLALSINILPILGWRSEVDFKQGNLSKSHKSFDYSRCDIEVFKLWSMSRESMPSFLPNICSPRLCPVQVRSIRTIFWSLIEKSTLRPFCQTYRIWWIWPFCDTAFNVLIKEGKSIDSTWNELFWFAAAFSSPCSV